MKPFTYYKEISAHIDVENNDKRSSIKYRRLGSDMYPFRKKMTLLQQVLVIIIRNGNSLNFRHISLNRHWHDYFKM